MSEAGSRGGMFVSARTYDEYLEMFDLRGEDWRGGTVLDCAAGGASFTAEWNARGGAAVACDPLYGLPAEEQMRAVVGGVERAVANIVAEPERYVWRTFGGPNQHRQARQAAAELFGRDLQEHPTRYVPGSLPKLPFGGQFFDLALCSYLLFAYSSALSPDDHVAYARELVRVAREVRIFPLVGFEGDAAHLVDVVESNLCLDGRRVERCSVRYEFLRGATEYLRVTTP